MNVRESMRDPHSNKANDKSPSSAAPFPLGSETWGMGMTLGSLQAGLCSYVSSLNYQGHQNLLSLSKGKSGSPPFRPGNIWQCLR